METAMTAIVEQVQDKGLCVVATPADLQVSALLHHKRSHLVDLAVCHFSHQAQTEVSSVAVTAGAQFHSVVLRTQRRAQECGW